MLVGQTIVLENVHEVVIWSLVSEPREVGVVQQA